MGPRGRRFGPGGFGPGGFGFGPGGVGPGSFGFGPGRFGAGGPRRGRGRGRLRASILVLLAEQPRHGYELITVLGERSGGMWKPSPGSVYPLLQQLEDEGLIRLQETPERKVFELTEAGRTWLAEHAEEARDPWHDHGRHVPEGTVALMHGFKQLAAAGWQVAQTGTPAQVGRAREVIDAARRDIYRILAGDDPAADPTNDPTADPAPDPSTES